MPLSELSGHSNYPGGFPNGVTIRGLPVLNAYAGKVFWVDSTAPTSGKGTFDRPFLTLAEAFDLCTANNGDQIHVKAGHSESISTADIDFDVAGVSVIGYGAGSSRPTILYTGTTDTTTLDISANDVTLHNFLFSLTDNDAVDSCIVVNGTDVTISNCEFRATANDQADTFITVGVADADADRCSIVGCKFLSLTAGANSAILMAKDHDAVVIAGNWIDGDFADAGISIPAAGDACTNLKIEGNYVRNRQTGDHAIEIAAVTSGLLRNNTLVADTVDIIVSPVANMIYDGNKGSIGNAATTGPAGGCFPVPAHFYGERARMIVKNSDTVDSGVTYTTGAATTLFTVTGAVFARVWGHVTTAVTSTGDNGTIVVGVTGNTAKLVPSYTAGSGTIVANDILGNAGTTAVPADDIEGAGTWVFLGGGEDIIATVATNNLTAGVIDWYCEWYPISETGRIVSA
jgi:hypothetical protein